MRHRSRRALHIDLELLESRRLLSGSVRTIDGTGNNLSNSNWGKADAELLRKSAAAYADGVSTPAGATRPSGRVISNAIAAADPDGTPNARDMSAWVYVWGQFIDHDLDLTVSASPSEAFNVAVPTGDSQFDPDGTGTQEIRLNRSRYSTGADKTAPRQQLNSITSWLDGSVVYGSDDARAAALRTFSGGMLKTSAGNLLPYNTMGLQNANDAHIRPDDRLFAAGDVRANENVDLIAIQTLFVREHNRLAAQIARGNPSLSDEQVYQRARAFVGAEIQAITYNEFLPALLGTGAIDWYRGYNPRVNPNISNEFSTAAFRLGHSLLGDDIEFLNSDGEEVRDELELRDAFFNPSAIEEIGIGPVLKYLASDPAQEIDNKVVDGVRNFLFGLPGQGGFDLASLNIQRGREHGLADYNTMRAAFGLPRVDSFDDITSDATLQAKLRTLYGNVNDIDAWVGGLAEDHARGSSVGPLFRAIVADQFERTRDGDRFWYERQFSGQTLNTLRNTTLAGVIRRNSEINNLQPNVFIFDVAIGGRVFNDRNGNGRQGFREAGLPGWSVQLLDEADEVVDATVTGLTGRYTFENLDLGTYTVNVVMPAGWSATNTPDEILLTRGGRVNGVDAGFVRTGTADDGSHRAGSETEDNLPDVVSLIEAPIEPLSL